MKGLTVTQIQQAFGKLPQPMQWFNDHGGNRPFEVMVKPELSSYELGMDRHPVYARVIMFRLVDTSYGLDWEIVS